jgi:DNA repair photolyase
VIVVADAREALVEGLPACGMLSVNPYRACDIRCAYCITGAQGVSRPRFGPEAVREQLRHELAEVGDRWQVAGLGTICDAYPSVEPELGVTRIVLDELVRLGWPVRVVTKGLTVRRDIDLLLAGDGHVTVSMSTLDADAAARLEPGAPSPARRVELAQDLADAGVRVWVSVSPWIPGVSDVSSIARAVGTAIAVRVAPLNVNSPEVGRTGFGQRFDQHEVDEAYLEAWRRAAGETEAHWLLPITAGGPGNLEQVMEPLEAASCASPNPG